MINYIKSELKHLPFVILVVICLYGFKVFADSYALSSMEVSFDNTGTNIQATNMQSAINEVYQHATDYNEIKTAIGSSTLTTTDKTLTGAVNELNEQVGNISASSLTLTFSSGSSSNASTGYSSCTSEFSVTNKALVFFITIIPSSIPTYTVHSRIDIVNQNNSIVYSAGDVQDNFTGNHVRTTSGTFIIQTSGTYKVCAKIIPQDQTTVTVPSYSWGRGHGFVLNLPS